MRRRIVIVSVILTLIIVFSYAQTFSVKDIREDLKKRDFGKLMILSHEFSETYEGRHGLMAIYVEPKGIIVTIDIWGGYSYKGINEKVLNDFFASLWRVFGYGISKYPPNTRVNFYIQIEGTNDSLIIEFPIGILSDFFKEKITRSDFLKQCEIWINGEKAIIEGEIIKISGEEFIMDFEF